MVLRNHNKIVSEVSKWSRPVKSLFPRLNFGYICTIERLRMIEFCVLELLQFKCIFGLHFQAAPLVTLFRWFTPIHELLG